MFAPFGRINWKTISRLPVYSSSSTLAIRQGNRDGLGQWGARALVQACDHGASSKSLVPHSFGERGIRVPQLRLSARSACKFNLRDFFCEPSLLLYNMIWRHPCPPFGKVLLWPIWRGYHTDPGLWWLGGFELLTDLQQGSCKGFGLGP